MKPILKWQYDNLVKELLLLQGHAADPSCPCASEGEACVRKHILTIEALADETVPIEPDPARVEKLGKISEEARQLRTLEEHKLCGSEIEPEDLVTWARKWRKEFELNASLACELLTQGNDKRQPARAPTCTLEHKTVELDGQEVQVDYLRCTCGDARCAVMPNPYGGAILVCRHKGDQDLTTEAAPNLEAGAERVFQMCSTEVS